tara:strand:+ start:206 stop:742 length:537 start_codon:yes stop_codon:yes gene_type:complete
MGDHKCATLLKSVNFGRRHAGLTTVGYTLLDEFGEVLLERQAFSDGVHEVGSNTGIYASLMEFHIDYASILWDTGGDTPLFATEQYNRLENNPRLDHTWEDVSFIKAITGGRWTIDPDSCQMVFYDDTNTGVIARYSLFGIDGNPCYDGVFSRVRNDSNLDCGCEGDLLKPPQPKEID